ncbi:MAG: MarR family transcriptional regulator [Subtercola sp.]|uniref:MarR family winged helix-turn-helix transcriptional regulator n=1 Tax=Subtercola endophyticus TaxID=2895559 RepID=UPI001E44EC87|nr:MarR family transcriptional regulator [Subtercola endophyticus]MCU1481476.1 MarR family transcriptional regulator [Subtercola sp.]UFS59779.1 MarR family transcriptional regulator [Subtercola endophyticus]
MNSELSALLGDLVTVTHRLTRLAAQATGETTSPASWRTLSVLTSAGPMRLGELAAASRVSQPTMTKIVRNLNELEWIKRIADSSDARAWLIAIAPKGERALDDWRFRLGVALEPLFADLSSRQLDVLAEATDLIGDRIGVQELAA